MFKVLFKNANIRLLIRNRFHLKVSQLIFWINSLQLIRTQILKLQINFQIQKSVLVKFSLRKKLIKNLLNVSYRNWITFLCILADLLSFVFLQVFLNVWKHFLFQNLNVLIDNALSFDKHSAIHAAFYFSVFASGFLWTNNATVIVFYIIIAVFFA